MVSPWRWTLSAVAVIAALAVVFVPLADAVPAYAGTTWIQLSPTSSPPARAAHSMAYDGDTGTLVVFGGFSTASGNVVYLNDTWIFDGTTWTQATGRNAPPPRAAAAMAWDAVAHEVVLFGGFNGRSYLADTWAWDGAHQRWSAQKPKQSPNRETGPGGFQNPLTGQACVFGGFNGVTGFFQLGTWCWTGRNWQQLQTANQPYARSPAFIANEFAGTQPGPAVTYSGLGDVNPNNTWVFDGTDWTLENPTVQPNSRYYSAAAFDPGLGHVVVFGGGEGGPDVNDLWEWTGTDWVQVIPDGTPGSPPARESHTMAYDQALDGGHAVLFGGENADGQLNDTWELVTTP